MGEKAIPVKEDVAAWDGQDDTGRFQVQLSNFLSTYPSVYPEFATVPVQQDLSNVSEVLISDNFIYNE